MIDDSNENDRVRNIFILTLICTYVPICVYLDRYMYFCDTTTVAELVVCKCCLFTLFGMKLVGFTEELM